MVIDYSVHEIALIVSQRQFSLQANGQNGNEYQMLQLQILICKLNC